MSQPTVTRHANGSITASHTENGVSLTISAGPGASPALLRQVFQAMKPALMPGHWEVDRA